MSASPKPILSNSPRFIPRRFSAPSVRSDDSPEPHSIDLRSSVRMFAAQIELSETDTVRSIGGRLGGSVRCLRSLDRQHDSHASLPSTFSCPIPRVAVDHLPTELTKLLPSSPGGLTVHSKDSDHLGLADGSPPLAMWIFPALSCAAAYAFYNIFIKKGSASIHPILGGVILQFVAALLGTLLIGSLMLFADKSFELHYDRNGLIWSVAAGLAVGLAEMLSFCVSGLGVPATKSIPIIIGGSVMFGAVLGLIVLGEKLMLQGWSGIALLVTGVVFVAIDPGEQVEEGEGGSSGEALDGDPPAYWVIIALICASAYAFYNIFIKKGSASINPILGGVVLQFVAAIFGTSLLGTIIMNDGGTSGLACDRAGIFWSCMAGLAVGTAEMLSFCVSGMGVNATQSIPIIIGGSVLAGAILGLFMLGETLMWPGCLGVALLTTGIGIVATDPGEKAAGH